MTDGSLDDLTREHRHRQQRPTRAKTRTASSRVGDTVTVANTDGNEVDLKVVAVLEPNLDQPRSARS